MRLSPRLTGPAVALGVLALGACGGGGSLAAQGETTAPSATASPAERAAKPTEPVEEDVTASAADCLVGTWGADNADLEASALRMFPGAQEAPTVEITGDYEQVFDGSTVTNSYRGQVSTVTMRVEGQEYRSVTTLDGRSTADYTVTDDRIEVTGVDTSAVTSTTETTIDGQVVPMPEFEAMALEAMGQDQVVTFTCTEDTLELTPQFQGQDAVPGYVQVLQRRG